MIKTFTVNGRKYENKEIDLNALCVFEDNGLSLLDLGKIDKKPLLFARAYLAFVGNMDAETAGNEINAHLIAGNGLDDVINAFTNALNDSGFFQAMLKNAEKNASTSKATKK